MPRARRVPTDDAPTTGPAVDVTDEAAPTAPVEPPPAPVVDHSDPLVGTSVAPGSDTVTVGDVEYDVDPTTGVVTGIRS